jgi:hypothetical protein
MSRLGRRGLGFLLGGAALPAWAQTPRPAAPPMPPVVRAVLPPCPTGSADIVGLVLEGAGGAVPAGTVVVFGQAFRAGDLPAGTGLAARLANGRPLAAQADVTTRHPDGSARFAVISLAAPALRAGERSAVVLTRDAAAVPTMLNFSTASSGRSAIVEIAPTDGGMSWRVDLLLRLLDLLVAPLPRTVWQRGPLAVQARIALPVPPAAVGGATSARLVADVALRADGTLWTDVWLRNDIAMREGGGTASCSMRVSLDGRETLSAALPQQFQYTGFGRQVGSTGRSAPVVPLVRHDIGYLAETGAIARYDLAIGVEERLLARMAQDMAAPEWNAPLDSRRITRRMGGAGNRADIGPVTGWQAAWLVSGDPRAAAFVQGQAEADGAIPWHFWDVSGGDGSGGWMDTRRWPRFWLDPRGGRPPFTLLQQMSQASVTGWAPDTAHHPALSFVPYLLTGRRSFLDGTLSEGFWGILARWPGPRAEATNVPAVRDVNIVAGGQIRSGAWTLRSLDNAAWIAPDDDPNGAYLRDAAAANWAWVRGMTAEWGSRQGEARGWIDSGYVIDPRGGLSTWQQDFFVASAAAAARRGNTDALAVLAWMENFVVGRFQAESRGFNPRDGIAYQMVVAPDGPDPRRAVFQTWAEIGAAMRERDMTNGDGWQRSRGYFGPLGLHSLAAIGDLLDSAAAKRAHAWLTAAMPPFTGPQGFAADPTYNVVKPGTPRYGCIPGR